MLSKAYGRFVLAKQQRSEVNMGSELMAVARGHYNCSVPIEHLQALIKEKETTKGNTVYFLNFSKFTVSRIISFIVSLFIVH